MRFFVWMLFATACSGGGPATDDPAGDDDDDTVIGDDDDDGVPIVQCTDAFDACGGDPTGTWNVAALCDIALDASALACDGITWEITEDRSSGTVDLNAGGTYTRQYNVDVDVLVHVPDTCLVGPLSCDNLATLSGGLFDSCTDTGTGTCDCSGTYDVVDAYSGTWTLDGNVIVTDDDERTEFCEQGNQAQTLHEDGTRVHWSR